MSTEQLLAVARHVEALIERMAMADSAADARDLAQRAREEISSLHSALDRARLSERVDDALGERLQRDET
jgi:hypothetical protein